jgi:hypothetical protein
MELDANPGDSRLRRGAIYCLTVWAVANSAALAIDYWSRSPMILGSGSEAAFTILKLVSLPSPMAGFTLACLCAITERRTLQTWGTLALPAAVFGLQLYQFLTASVY